MRKRRRVVSYKEYADYLAQKTVFESAMLLSSVVGFVCLLMTLLAAGGTLICFIVTGGLSVTLGPLLGTVILGAATWGFYKVGNASLEKSESMEPVAPPTRYHLDQLPAQETLVRASQEPAEEPEKVLLRATMTTEETEPEELLRASE